MLHADYGICCVLCPHMGRNHIFKKAQKLQSWLFLHMQEETIRSKKFGSPFFGNTNLRPTDARWKICKTKCQGWRNSNLSRITNINLNISRSQYFTSHPHLYGQVYYQQNSNEWTNLSSIQLSIYSIPGSTQASQTCCHMDKNFKPPDGTYINRSP